MLFVFKWQNGTRHKQTASGRASSHFPRHLSSLSLVQNIAVDICFVNSDSKPEGADYFSSTYLQSFKQNKAWQRSTPIFTHKFWESITMNMIEVLKLRYKVDGMFCIPHQLAVPANLPAAHCSSSAPFSQSRSPSHRHDNETHLLVAPPQSNLSGGHVCRPVWGVFFFFLWGWKWWHKERRGREEAADEIVGGIKADRREWGWWGAGWTGEEEEGEGQREREGTASQWNCLIT